MTFRLKKPTLYTRGPGFSNSVSFLSLEADIHCPENSVNCGFKVQFRSGGLKLLAGGVREGSAVGHQGVVEQQQMDVLLWWATSLDETM